MGAQRVRSFREAATKFLQENTRKRSLERDARAPAALDPYIGALPLRRVHHETVQTYVRARLRARISPGTVNRDLAVVRRILNLSARLWRDETDRPWLITAPLIQMQRGIGFEDRQVLLGHKSRHVTTHYSAPEIGSLIAGSEEVCALQSRKSPALSAVRVQQGAASG